MAAAATRKPRASHRTRKPARRLDRAREADLIQRWQRDGDAEARRILVESCDSLVRIMAWRYRHYAVEQEDLVAEGYLGVLASLDRFDTGKEVRLTTYARFWIRAYMVRAVSLEWRKGKTGVGVAPSRLFFRVRKDRARLSCEHADPERVLDRLVRETGMSRRRIASMLSALDTPEFSVDSFQDAQDRGHPSSALVDDSSDPESIVLGESSRRFLSTAVERALGCLSEKELVIVRERLMSDEPASLSTLGRRMGVSRERARQIEKQTLKKLARAVVRDGLTRVSFQVEIA